MRFREVDVLADDSIVEGVVGNMPFHRRLERLDLRSRDVRILVLHAMQSSVLIHRVRENVRGCGTVLYLEILLTFPCYTLTCLTCWREFIVEFEYCIIFCYDVWTMQA